MGIIGYEAAEYNKVGKENIQIGRNMALSMEEKAEEDIKKYKESSLEEEPSKVSEFTSEMLGDIKEKINGRPTMGDIQPTENVYMKDDRDDDER